MSSQPSAKGLGAVATAAIAFSWGFSIVKAISMGGPLLAMWRVGLGAATLSVLAVVFRSRWPRELRFVLLAGAAMGTHQILYILATQSTSIAIVTLIGALMPLLVAVMAQFMVGERFEWRVLVWALVALIGIGVVVGANLDDPSRSLTGDLLAIVNIVVFTTYFLAAKRSRMGGVGTIPLTAAVMWIALFFVAPVALLAGPFETPDGRDFGLLALLTLGPGNGHLLVNWAHDRVPASVSSLILLMVPLLASLWAHLVHGEPFGPLHMVGIAVVAIAIEGGRRAQFPRPRP